MCKLNEYFSTLEVKLSVTNRVNTLLPSRLNSIEQCVGTQYSRREYLDITGIPRKSHSHCQVFAREELPAGLGC